MDKELENEVGSILGNIWEQSKTPLEKMWDCWIGEGAWEPENPQSLYQIFGWEDIRWQGLEVLAGHRFPCHLCGSKTKWKIEGNEVTRAIRVFVCEHEPISIGRGSIRQVSTVPARLVAWFEETYRFYG